jgi:hypothetical protein
MAESIPYIAAPFTGGVSLLAAKPVRKAIGRALKQPGPPGAPQAVTTQTTAVQQAAADAAARRSRARGQASTILSGFLDQSQLKQTIGS